MSGEPNIHVLMVDDERHISGMTREYLQTKGFQVELSHNAEAAIKAFRSRTFHVCILDIKMPMKDGYTLASEIRALAPNVPVIFLTGKAETEDRIRGLKLGADDYITKPYSLEELVLRMHNVLRRTQRHDTDDAAMRFHLGPWEFDVRTRELKGEGATVALTTTEARLLQMFCQSADGYVRRDDALRQIWGDEYKLRDRSLNVYISKLRKVLGHGTSVEILNVHSDGYRMIVR